MQILKTREELENAVGTSSFGWVSMSRKQGADIHPGHEALITYSNTNFDLTVVNYWNSLELVYALFGGERFLDEIGNAWDSTGCYNWCEAHGVDYVISPDVGYSSIYLQSMGIDTVSDVMSARRWVDAVWEDNNYLAYEATKSQMSQYNSMLGCKTRVIIQNWKTHLNCTCISSWKDGWPIFTACDYITKYTPENYIILDPIKSPDGLYYSSNYNIYTEAQKNAIKQIDAVVDTVGYDDTTALISAINNIGEGLEAYRIDVAYGGVVGEANDFINVLFTIEGNTDSWPIYKKGVR